MNLLMNNNPEALVKMMYTYSSSVKARRNIGILYEGGLNLEDFDIPEDATNRSAEITNIDLKALGVRINFKKKGSKK